MKDILSLYPCQPLQWIILLQNPNWSIRGGFVNFPVTPLRGPSPLTAQSVPPAALFGPKRQESHVVRKI